MNTGEKDFGFKSRDLSSRILKSEKFWMFFISSGQGSDKPGKPGKNSVFCDRENLENSGNFKEIFEIPGKLREFC